MDIRHEIEVVLNIVATESDVLTDDILSNKRNEDITDARHLAVYLLHKRGIYVHRIAEGINITRRAVYNIISHFDERLQWNKVLRSNLARALNRLGTSEEISAV